MDVDKDTYCCPSAFSIDPVAQLIGDDFNIKSFTIIGEEHESPPKLHWLCAVNMDKPEAMDVTTQIPKQVEL